MLVLSRKLGEGIWIGDQIRVSVLRIGPNAVRIGIEAPSHLGVVREELVVSDETGHPIVHPPQSGQLLHTTDFPLD